MIGFPLRRMQSFITLNGRFGDYDYKPVLQCVEGSFLLLAASVCGRYYEELLKLSGLDICRPTSFLLV